MSTQTTVPVPSIASWVQVGRQAGSNPGGVYQSPDGTRYYVKFAKSDDHARNEVLASKLYKLAGISSVELFLVDTGKGLGTASEMIGGAKSDLFEKLSDADYLAKIHEGFAVDAWLANWDVAGLVYDNIVTDAHGDPVRVDPGGALLYRAMGAPKGHLFGDTVGELETLRNGTSAQSAAIFGTISPESFASSVDRVFSISPEALREAVESVGFDPETSSRLVDTLEARSHSIAVSLIKSVR